MSQPLAIQVQGLSKRYKIYKRNSDMFWEILFPNMKRHSEFWALQDISFDVGRGEVVGVVGRNGAGKSTLLKILAQTLNATKGDVEVNGKISAILELGTGFNPEFTGRQNVIIGGMCLGMSKSVVEQKMESIIEFSGLSKVIDQPFKTYSSGMQARLTFSTAISIDPDILIIDEALAAGDAYFVSKSMKRIEEICKSGATVLFVSHSLNLVERFCSKVIYMQDGRIKEIGPTKKVCKSYELDLLAEQQLSNQKQIEERLNQERDRLGTGEVRIEDFRVLDSDGNKVTTLTVGKSYSFEISYECFKDDLPAVVEMQVFQGSGNVAFSTRSTAHIDRSGHEQSIPITFQKGKGTVVIKTDHLWLGRGEYFVSLGVAPKEDMQAIEDYYDYLHMRWNFNMTRSGVVQWVFYEQAVEFEINRISE